jgi:hypothetical protein
VLPAQDDSGQLVLSSEVRESKRGFIFPIAIGAETGVFRPSSTPVMHQSQCQAGPSKGVAIGNQMEGFVPSHN